MGEESGSCEVGTWQLMKEERWHVKVPGSRFIISPSQAPPLACFIIALQNSQGSHSIDCSATNLWSIMDSSKLNGRGVLCDPERADTLHLLAS
jgi:hypothetical protein